MEVRVDFVLEFHAQLPDKFLVRVALRTADLVIQVRDKNRFIELE
jgi:hypothetical protein